MIFTPDNILLNEIARDSFYSSIPLPFRGQIKTESEKQRNAIVKEWQKPNSRDKVATMKADYRAWAEMVINAVNEYKPLTKKHAFDIDALNRKAGYLANDLYQIQNQFSSHFQVNEDSSHDDKRGALMAMAQVYKRFRRLTLTGLSEEYQWQNRAVNENVITVESLDFVRYLKDEEYQSEILSTLLKALRPEWWVRRYKKAFKRMSEEFAIKCGFVKKGQMYCTDHALNQTRLNDRRNQLFLEGVEMERDDGFTVSLAEVIKHSLSNPFNRHAQLMARIAGLEKLGKHENKTALFFTLTAPSRFHRNSDKYDGSTPNETREYLQKTWEQMRAKFNRKGFDYFGVRVAESHKDACPHWHLMLWIDSKQVEVLSEIFIEYAEREDFEELYNDNWEKMDLIRPSHKNKGVIYRSPRCEVKQMLAHLGHPTGYIIKYISKNIQAHDDSKAPENVTNYADRVTTWARTHRIRQFQFIGDEKVTPWNEARRVSPEIIKKKDITLSSSAKQFIEVCRSNDWFNYVRFMRKFNVTVVKTKERDAESETFAEKVEILGLEVEHKNPMWRLHLANVERFQKGIKTVSQFEAGLSLGHVDAFAEKPFFISTKFYNWNKVVKGAGGGWSPPDNWGGGIKSIPPRHAIKAAEVRAVRRAEKAQAERLARPLESLH